MKSVKAILLLLFVCIHFCHAQDTVITISPAMFVGNQEIPIAAKNGWMFREGNDTVWAKPGIDLTGWKKFAPVELSTKNVDKNGKVEGWFRLRLKLDSSFNNMQLGLRLYCWAAIDLYVDGKFIQSFGNTGANNKPFEEFNPNERLPVLVDMASGKEHLIAFHFVEERSTLPGHLLKSQYTGLQQFIKLTGPVYYQTFSEYLDSSVILQAVWFTVSMILCLLFWLLAFQNPKEKNLWLISIFMTLSAASILFEFLNYGHQNSFVQHRLYNYFGVICDQLSYFMIPLIIINIFKRKLIWDLKIFIALCVTIPFSFIFSSLLITYVTALLGCVYYLNTVKTTLKGASWLKIMRAVFKGSRVFLGLSLVFIIAGLIVPNSYQLVFTVILITICAYYIISSWKAIKGAQWAIVAGLLLTVLWLLATAIASSIYQQSSIYPYNRLYGAGALLSFPLSLLVYVSTRFKEFIKEVQENAQQVLQLSEDKRKQAVNQQKILQDEVNRQTAEVRATLDNLKATQSQLIQSEKMASLGELTAGIAHEIQNPLNFVNNFSEVSAELLDEMNEELNKGDIEEAKAISSDIKQNLEKITHHGKRADAIVKGMLQHSRSSSGIMEPTDLNALCDEYLRLSYHGLRAKDKSFNATIQTNFDTAIEKLNLIPQDFGRVVLNLLTNAFYTVDEKYKNLNKGNNYQPTVTIATKANANNITVTVTDNGNGMPQEVIEKIFQPFFTTKPTGKGTGLGLSMSYDIIKKGHNGELKVSSTENEGTTFSIIIPNSKA